MKYLADTDWLIDSLHEKGIALDVVNRLAGDGVGVSIVTVAEIYEGAYHAPDPGWHLSELRAFLEGFDVIEVDDPIANRFAAIRADLRRQGNLLPDLDLFVAATALVHQTTLLTRNVKHFSRIQGLSIYEEDS
jgi:tRNA(fMet)-specific endonuclease VapC